MTPDAPRQVLDLGTGTGILTLAALALGAERVVAVEYNELAVRTAARNLKHNQRQGQVHLIQADARHFAHLPADLALANIHLDVLLDLLDIPGVSRQGLVYLLRHPGDPDGEISGAPRHHTPHPCLDPGRKYVVYGAGPRSVTTEAKPRNSLRHGCALMKPTVPLRCEKSPGLSAPWSVYLPGLMAAGEKGNAEPV